MPASPQVVCSGSTYRCVSRGLYPQWLRYCAAVHSMLEYNAYSTLHWVIQCTGGNLCEELSVGWREYSTLVAVHRDLYTVSRCCAERHSYPGTQLSPLPPLSLSCNTTRLRIEGLSKDFRSRPGLACSSISQILTPQYAIICTVQGIARQTGKRYRGEGGRYLGVHTRTSPPCTPHPCHLCGCGPAHLYRRVAARYGCVLPVCLSIASMSLPLTAQSTLL